MRQLYLSLLGLLLFTCEEPIDQDLVIPRAQLVVSSTFFPDQPVRIGLTSTFNVLNSDRVVSVSNAVVTLFSGNQLLEELVYVDSVSTPYYTTQRLLPTVGVLYTMHIVAPGFDPVTAISAIPPPIPIDHFELDRLSKRSEGDVDIYDITLHIDYSDPIGEINFYNLRLLQRTRNFVVAYNGDTIYTDYSLKPIVFAESPQGYYKRLGNGGGILLQDRPEDAPLRIRYETQIDRFSEKIDQVYAELRTVSPEYYYYQRSIAQQGSGTLGSGLNPAGVIQTNVENGNGIFAGYAVSSDSIRLRSL